MIYVEQLNYEELKVLKDFQLINQENLKIFSQEYEKDIDVIITIGGDGTILYAMKHF